VLLEPLGRVVGSSHAACTLLLELARAQGHSSSPLKHHHQHHQRSILHHLGFELGIVEWQEDWRAATVSKKQLQDQQQPAAHASAERPGTQAIVGSLQAPGAMEVEEVKAATSAATAAGKPTLLQQVNGQPAQTQGPEHGAAGAAGEAAVRGPGAGQHTTDADMVKVEHEEVAITEAATESCRSVIESIRRDEFGLGLELEGVGGRLREVQNARMGRALQRLSAELYSRDTHFVLELVQNAGEPCVLLQAKAACSKERVDTRTGSACAGLV
jgi:hypothetical protein